MKAYQKATKACLEKIEANQKMTGAIAEHYEWVPCVEAMKEWAADVLHRDPNGATY
jgi:hypothetical protein